MRFTRSQKLYQRSCRTTPGGIHSNVRKNWRPHPMFYERGKGSHVWDADGNEFIDYVLARGPLLLGHLPGPVIETVKRQLDRGLMYAGQHELEIEAAEKFCELIPCADMVRFAGSGSEAIHAAIRLARGITGRTKILRFEGHYHGWFDNIFWNYAPPIDKAGPREAPNPIPVSGGQLASDGEHLIIRPWNDLNLIEDVFKRFPGEIAAVLMEPIMCNTGCIMPRPDYLEGIRRLCTDNGALLIFDEVITGFRVSLGGAQEYFGVTPDIVACAKGMAGGFPVSALAGKEEFMQAFGDLSVTHSGTYNSNVPCMAACLAAMNMLSADKGALLKHAHDLGQQLIEGIKEAARKAGKDLHVRGLPMVFHISFNDAQEIVDYRSFTSRDVEAYNRFWSALQDRGIRTIPEGLWFVSTAHTQKDVDQTLAVVDEALKEV
ncbi:MAG: aspartate aminotransferase family protein [Planctomycetota bacterium]|nr:MAG: aspartate aminotransferase family protein [Planctomycetota bacterium]